MSTIQLGHNVILRLPSGTYKVINISETNTSCSLGKFGTFDTSHLLGQEYGLSYEIQEDKTLKSLTVENLQTLEEEVASDVLPDDVESVAANNEFIVDHQESNQVLSHEEIRALRDGTHDRAALIEKLKQNNKSFALKTSFSQAKYMKRKMSKFIKRFTTIPATIFDVLEYLISKDADRVMQITQESLAYFLNTADIRPGCEYLVVDETSGLLSCALLERGANVTIIHETEHVNLDILKYLPQFSQDELIETKRVRSLSWEEAVDTAPVLAELDQYIESKGASKYSRDQDKARKRALHKDAIIRHRDHMYEGLLVMSEHTPVSILTHLLPHINYSRKVAVYSTYREPLLTLRHHDFDGSLLMPNITELRARGFQILPGRTRPVMTQRGEYGYVYHAIKVKPTQGINATGKHSGRRIEKEAHRSKLESTEPPTKKIKTSS